MFILTVQTILATSLFNALKIKKKVNVEVLMSMSCICSWAGKKAL